MTDIIELSPSDKLDLLPVSIQRGLDWWRNGAHHDDTFDSLLPELQLLFPTELGYQYGHVGMDSTAAHVFGEDWAADCLGVTVMPDEDFMWSVYAAYLKLTQGPYLGTVDAVVSTALGTKLHVSYTRLMTLYEPYPNCHCVALFTEFNHTPRLVS